MYNIVWLIGMKQIPNQLFFEWVEQEIAEGRSVRFRLVGHSMFPLIRNGKDEVLLTPCADEELRPMDVVLFHYQGKHVLHRILRREGSRLILQGDGSLVAKELCNTADVVGKVSEIVRPSGKAVSVHHWSWRLSGFLWVKLGVLRRPIIRIYHRFFI